MMIADAQVHIWLADSPERPWPPIVDPTQSRAHKPEPITMEIMLREMDAAGVKRAVIAPRCGKACATTTRWPRRNATRTVSPSWGAST